MTKTIRYAAFGFFLWQFSLHAQLPSTLDLLSIEEAVTNKKSEFFYPTMLGKLRSKEVMRQDELVHLYYGWAYSGNYNPYFRDPGLGTSVAFLRDKEWASAIRPAMKVWESDPVNLQALYYLMIAHHELGDTVTAHFYGNLFYRFVDIIIESGDGLGVETAFVVNRIKDEYILLEQFDLEISRQALVGQVDVMTLKEPVVKEDGDTLFALYFNVYQPLSHLQNSLSTGKNKKKSKKKNKVKARRETL